MDWNKHFSVALLGRGLVLVDRRPYWTDILFYITWNSDAVFSHCSICTELHCRMYCCLINTNIGFVTFITVPTSCVPFTVTLLDTLSLCTKDNCSKNTKLQRTSGRTPTHFTIKHKSVNSLQITSLLFYVSIWTSIEPAIVIKCDYKVGSTWPSRAISSIFNQK